MVGVTDANANTLTAVLADSGGGNRALRLDGHGNTEQYTGTMSCTLQTSSRRTYTGTCTATREK
jgi:hypothetical protein